MYEQQLIVTKLLYGQISPYFTRENAKSVYDAISAICKSFYSMLSFAILVVLQLFDNGLRAGTSTMVPMPMSEITNTDIASLLQAADELQLFHTARLPSG